MDKSQRTKRNWGDKKWFCTFDNSRRTDWEKFILVHHNHCSIDCFHPINSQVHLDYIDKKDQEILKYIKWAFNLIPEKLLKWIKNV